MESSVIIEYQDSKPMSGKKRVKLTGHLISNAKYGNGVHEMAWLDDEHNLSFTLTIRQLSQEIVDAYKMKKVNKE